MRESLLVLAAVALLGTTAFAEVMPMLTAYPGEPTFPGSIWEQTNGGADLQVHDAGAIYPFLAGHAEAPTGIGDDYWIEGTIKFDNLISELGFIGRANILGGKTYACSFDPQNGYFNLVKIWDGTSFGNLENINTGLSPAEDSEWRIRFGAENEGDDVRLRCELFESDGDLVTAFNYLDEGAVGPAPYTSGQVGIWSFKVSGGTLGGTWTGMDVSVIPEPTTLGLVGLGALVMIRRRRK